MAWFFMKNHSYKDWNTGMTGYLSKTFYIGPGQCKRGAFMGTVTTVLYCLHVYACSYLYWLF